MKRRKMVMNFGTFYLHWILDIPIDLHLIAYVRYFPPIFAHISFHISVMNEACNIDLVSLMNT